jgi:hypothetical protein
MLCNNDKGMLGISDPPCDRDVLPNLREVVLVRPELTFCLEGRPIQALTLAFIQPVHTRDVGLKAITALNLFNGTLQTLFYKYPSTLLGWNLGDIVRAIAQNAPNLRTLTLSWFLMKVSMLAFAPRKFNDTNY